MEENPLRILYKDEWRCDRSVKLFNMAIVINGSRLFSSLLLTLIILSPDKKSYLLSNVGLLLENDIERTTETCILLIHAEEKIK